MTIAVLPTDFQIYSSLRQFLLDNLPSDTPVVRGQANRVPEPKKGNFVVLTEIAKERLETNIDSYADTAFTASIAVAGTLTVTNVFYGTISLGSLIFGVGVPANTIVTGTVGGTGGVGTYQVSSGTAILGARTMACGVLNMLQPVEVTVQVDVHGPNSGDNVHLISTMLRDEYATTAFKRYGPDVTPLYADDPKQVPFINDSKQYEDRWILMACLQANQAVLNIPQQFFDTVLVGLIEVDSHYPA